MIIFNMVFVWIIDQRIFHLLFSEWKNAEFRSYNSCLLLCVVLLEANWSLKCMLQVI